MKSIRSPIGRIFLAVMLIYSMIMLTACPGKSTLTSAFNESAKVYALGTTAASTVGNLYDSHVISLELKDKIIAGLKKVAESGRKFHTVLLALKTQYENEPAGAPKSKLAELDILFSSTVIEPFLDIITSLGVLPPGTAQAILLAVGTLKTAILAVSQIFGFGSASYQFYNREVNGHADQRSYATG